MEGIDFVTYIFTDFNFAFYKLYKAVERFHINFLSFYRMKLRVVAKNVVRTNVHRFLFVMVSCLFIKI